MPAQPIVHGSVGVDLKPSPIDPTWIRGGAPVARNAMLSKSRDGAACTVVWECTPGAFDWHYGTDETIHVLEGSVVLDDGVAPPRRVGPGDVVLFPAGAVVRWTVETKVRKLAFFHRPMPRPLALLARALGKARAVLGRLGAAAPRPASTAPGMGLDASAG